MSVVQRPGNSKQVIVLVLAINQEVCLADGLSPAEELRSFELADRRLTIELVAAEPAVVSPVALAWDAQGRLWVAEMRDYPNASTQGTIRCLEDRDQNGVYETSRVFADGLSFPNSVLPWRDGVLVTAAPDLLFLRDTNGDGKADDRQVWFTGFGTGNQQLRANGLQWGGDGWIYGANGRSDGIVRRPGVPGETSLRGRDFRFRPDTREFEGLAGRSQFGLAIDDWGDRLLSWNTIPARHEVFPDRLLAGNSQVPSLDVLQDLLPPGDLGEVFPLTPLPRVFNSESSRHFNALAGLTYFSGEALGAEYWGNLFMGETLLNVVHRRRLVPAGATFTAERVEVETEFLRSRDPWFHPVNFATGPDGALYIADFHREYVEHPDFVPLEMRSRLDWRTGHQQGRIWRVRRVNERRFQRVPSLSRESTLGLIRRMDSDNPWQRDTAQRLLWERKDARVLKAVARLAEAGKIAETRRRALQWLGQWPQVSTEVYLRALSDTTALVRGEALRQLGNRIGVGGDSDLLAQALVRATQDPEPRVRLRAAQTLAVLPDATRRESILRNLAERDPDRWVRRAAIGTSRNKLPKEIIAAAWPLESGPLRPAPVFPQPSADREKVVQQYRSVLETKGDPDRGAALFSRLCLPCHTLQGLGYRVGPDLAGIAARPAEALLTDILDPSRQVAPEYSAYEFQMEDGETIHGLFASESATRVTIRRPGAADANVARKQIRSVLPLGRSLMPDGMEAELDAARMGDLLAFLKAPDSVKLVP